MKFIETETYGELSARAAEIIGAQVLLKPRAVLGLATGSSPLGTYALLAEKYARGELDFSEVTTVNLDEYIGLSGENEQSYRYFMDKNLFEKINVKRENTHVPNGCAEDLEREGEDYDALISSLGGIDIQLLGIGLDGHIGFNEPGECFVGGTHTVELDASTVAANARFFESEADVPRSAITMGMASIMQAKKILLIANGEAKREILMRACFGEITPKVPASILRLHPDVTVIFSKN